MEQYHETILVVEDDVQIRNFICYALKAEGFRCVTAGNAATAMKQLLAEPVDMMLLDLGLPDMDGGEVLKKVREWSEMPIIIVSARATELMARIRVALRHLYRQGLPRPQSVYRVGGLELDVEKHAASLDGEPLHLTPMEFSLMTLLMKNAGKVLTSGYLLKEVWGVSYDSDTQALRALMAALRRKIEKNPAKPRYLLTEIGIGYRMADE